MRLIDADSLIDLVTDSTILGGGFKTAFCALVNGEPTVKVQKTGKWFIEPRKGAITCSTCKEEISYYPSIGIKPIWDYCPYCGSYNGGEKDE